MQARSSLCLCVLLVASPTTAAAEGPTERAATLFKQGRAAMERKKLAEACPMFAESARLDPAPGTFLNLALCEEGLGRVGKALTAYRTVVAMLPSHDERVPFAKQHAKALEARVARLTLVLSPAVPREAQVFQDGVEVARRDLGTEGVIDPGPHEVKLRIPGAPDTDLSVSLNEGERRTLVVMPAPGSRAQPASAPTEATSGPDAAAAPGASPGPTWQAPLGFAIGGLGVASIAAGFVTGALVLKKKDIVDSSCDQTQVCDSQAGVDAAAAGRTLSTISTITFAAGGAALAAGLILVLTSPGPESEKKTAVALAPLPDGGGLAVWRSF